MDGKAKIFELMMSEIENGAEFDWPNRLLHFKNHTQNIDDFFLTKEGSDDTFSLNMTLRAGFTQTFGKFPAAYGNVVLSDCHYLFDNLLDWFD